MLFTLYSNVCETKSCDVNDCFAVDQWPVRNLRPCHVLKSVIVVDWSAALALPTHVDLGLDSIVAKQSHNFLDCSTQRMATVPQ